MAKSRTRIEFERAWKRFNGRIGKRGSLARMIAEGAYIGWKLAKGVK